MGAHRLTVAAVEVVRWRKTQPSQEAAAGVLGVSQQYLSKVERGERVPKRIDVLEKFRDRCGIPFDAWRELSRKRVPARTRVQPFTPPARGAA